jgi:MYXO-CTERM domain-containing protein
MRTSIFSSRLVLSGAVLATAAVGFSSVMPGCGTDSVTPSFVAENDVDNTEGAAVADDQPANAAKRADNANDADDTANVLRQAFPDHAAEVLDQETKFAGHSVGYWRRWGGSADVGATAPGAGSFGVMDAFLPKKAEDAVRLVVGNGFEVRLREVGTEGEGRSVANAIAYSRAGGTSYWTAAAAGAEEWLHLAPEYVRSDVPAVTWEVEGGTLHVMPDGDRVAVLDKAGVARIWATAPKAVTVTGEAVETSFEAEGNRLSLYVDAEGEELLVDPVWTTAAPMATPRAYGVPVVLQNGKVLVAAGYSSMQLASAELYDPVTNMWTSASSMYANAGHVAGLLSSGRVIVAGGYNGTTCLSTVNFYDPATNSWSAGPSMATGRCLPKAAVLPDGRFVVTGGQTELIFQTFDATTSVEIYNPATNTWTTAAPMAGARFDHAATLLNDGRLLIAGGTTDNANAFSSAEIYNPANNTWSSAGALATARHDYSLTLLADGRALAVGGVNGSGTTITNAEVYNPMTNSWSTVSSISGARAGHSANRLGGGSVLIAGGYTTNPTGITSAQLFNPMTNTWSAMPSMSVGRAYHGAVVISGGRVLVTAGQTGSGTFTATAELFSNGAIGDGCTQAVDCQSGFCADGVCCQSACGTATDCQVCNAPGSVGTCTLAPAATVCRGASGACDTPEVCNGMNTACPVDVLAVAGTACRAAAGTCDVAESCTGMSALCPADGFVMTGTVCRAAVDVCDAPEACTGVTAACPNDAVLGAGVACRAAAGVCDVAESCNGVSPLCPANTFTAAGTSCRASGGPCDLGEACTGTAANCPMDAFVPAGTSCRQAVGPCDAAETCNGTAAACPADAFAAAGTMCRAATGPCDAAEACNGTETVCPIDLLMPVGTSCRAAVAACDAEEKCDGTSTSCPVDGLLPAGSECRAAANACDVAEVCTGGVATCPGDLNQPDGIVCDDGNPCSLVDSCKAGQCAAGTPVDCSAKDECQNNGACDPATGACVAPPPKADGTMCKDGTCQSGTCTPPTSGSSSSSGAGGAGGSVGEGGSAGTGGRDPNTDSGCACRIAGASEQGKAPWILLGAALIAGRRVRRTRVLPRG